MIVVDNVILSDDIKDNFFVCDLKKCKGACCVEGDLGAPLSKEETKIIDEILDVILPYLSPLAINKIKKNGAYVLDNEDDISTNTVNGKECVFAYYDENKILKCGFETAYSRGQTNFLKPISCHLYPLRISKYEGYDAVNYDRWYICNDACLLGEKLEIPIYKFLKVPLVRKYGVYWYDRLIKQIENGNLPFSPSPP